MPIAGPRARTLCPRLPAAWSEGCGMLLRSWQRAVGCSPGPGHGDVPQNCKTLSGLKKGLKKKNGGEVKRDGMPRLIRGPAARRSRVTRRISPATTRFERGWEERAGEGVKSCFLKKNPQKTLVPSMEAIPGHSERAGTSPGWLTLPAKGLGCFKCIVF